MRLWCSRQGKNNEKSRITKQQTTAEEHIHTKGCKVSADLTELVKTYTSVDEELLQFERQLKLTGVLNAEDIAASANIATSLSDGIKAGGKKAAALQSLWNLLKHVSWI